MYTYLHADTHSHITGTLRGVVVNVLNCNIVVSKFKLQSRYYIHFRSNIIGIGINSINPQNGLNNITVVLLQ